MRAQHFDGPVVEKERALPVRRGVADDDLAGHLLHSPLDDAHSTVEVEVGPPQAAHFPAPTPATGTPPRARAPCLLRRRDEADDRVDALERTTLVGLRRRRRPIGDVVVDPPPLDSLRERARLEAAFARTR